MGCREIAISQVILSNSRSASPPSRRLCRSHVVGSLPARPGHSRDTPVTESTWSNSRRSVLVAATWRSSSTARVGRYTANCRAMSEYRSLEEPRDVSQRVLCATTASQTIAAPFAGPERGLLTQWPDHNSYPAMGLTDEALFRNFDGRCSVNHLDDSEEGSSCPCTFHGLSLPL